MSIKDELKAELVSAMKAGDETRKTAVRQIESEVAKAKAEPGSDGSDEDAIYEKVIAAYIKRTRKSLAEYESYGEKGAATAAGLAAEIEFLSPWGPEEASEEEITAAAREIIAELGAESPKDMGPVMKELLARFEGKVDGGTASPIVKGLLIG